MRAPRSAIFSKKTAGDTRSCTHRPLRKSTCDCCYSPSSVMEHLRQESAPPATAAAQQEHEHQPAEAAGQAEQPHSSVDGAMPQQKATNEPEVIKWTREQGLYHPLRLRDPIYSPYGPSRAVLRKIRREERKRERLDWWAKMEKEYRREQLERNRSRARNEPPPPPPGCAVLSGERGAGQVQAVPGLGSRGGAGLSTMSYNLISRNITHKMCHVLLGVIGAMYVM